MSIPVNATAASILGFLAREPMSGWELCVAFERSIGHFWNITRSQVYRELRTLGGKALVTIGETGARERRVCTITPAGRAVFRTWIAEMPGEELIRFPLLLTVFFGDAVSPETLRAACTAHRKIHAARLAEYESQRAAASAHPFPAQALEFGIAYERTVLAWLDELPAMTPGRAPSKDDRANGSRSGKTR